MKTVLNLCLCVGLLGAIQLGVAKAFARHGSERRPEGAAAAVAKAVPVAGLWLMRPQAPEVPVVRVGELVHPLRPPVRTLSGTRRRPGGDCDAGCPICGEESARAC